MSRTIQQALTIGALAMLIVAASAPAIASAQAPRPAPAKLAKSRVVVRPRVYTSAQLLRRARSLPNGSAILSAIDAKPTATTGGSTGSGPAVQPRSGSIAAMPPVGSILSWSPGESSASANSQPYTLWLQVNDVHNVDLEGWFSDAQGYDWIVKDGSWMGLGFNLSEPPALPVVPDQTWLALVDVKTTLNDDPIPGVRIGDTTCSSAQVQASKDTEGVMTCMAMISVSGQRIRWTDATVSFTGGAAYLAGITLMRVR